MDGDTRVPQPVNDRVSELEKKVREMEALIKGLTNELLDLKSIVERMSSRMEEKRPVMTRPPGRVAVSPKGQPGEAAPADEGELVRIMQPDGTMKEERRKDSDYIVASAKSAQALRNKGKGEPAKGKGSNALIYAVEEEDSKSKQ
ncbi:MAG TPA: hypothetical protein VK450_04445 [Methanomicrobiales archaeon]|nr:hypothetical protein [Methanomicrobiales archaeon]